LFEEKREGLQEFLLVISQSPSSICSKGQISSENEEVRRWGEIPKIRFSSLNLTGISVRSWAILDFKNGSKIAEARFTLYWDLGQVRESPHQFHAGSSYRGHGYREVLPSLLWSTDNHDRHRAASKF